MEFLYIKAFHIVFVVTWFSGLFYLGRLFIYNREAHDKPSPEREILQTQFQIMIRRLHFGITWPSAVLTLIFGTWLLFLYPSFPIWLYIKLGLVVLLFLYQITLHQLYKEQSGGIFTYTSNQLRMWNEVPTVFLVAIVLLVVVRQNMSVVYGMLGLAGFIALLLMAIRIYKALR